MASADRRDRPPLSLLNSGPAGAFGALLSRTVEDPQAARGFAFAYASLPLRQRAEIIEAIVVDAGAEGINLSEVLAPLLSVEEDPQVARQLADAISAAGGRGLSPVEPLRALLAGDEPAGAFLLVRPLHGRFAETLGLVWEQARGITHATYEPLAHTEDPLPVLPGVADGLHFEEMPLSYALDIVTPVLWGHRRAHGALPEQVRPFADLFTIHPCPSPDGSAGP